MRIQVAQESAAGAGDFDSHVVGTVDAYVTTGTVASYYQYDGTSSGRTANPDLRSFRNQVNTMFVVGSDGLGFITIHGPRRGGGSAGDLLASSQHDLSVGTFLTPLDVRDDATDTFTFANGNTRLTATTVAGGSSSDGFASRFTEAEPVILSQLLSFSNNVEGWTVHGSGGSSLSVTPTVGRRVRFNVSWAVTQVPTPDAVAGWRLLSVPVGGLDVLDLAQINYVGGVQAGATNPAQYPRQGYFNTRFGTQAGNLFSGYLGTETTRNAADTADSTAYIYVPAPNTDYAFEAGKGLWWYWYHADFNLGSSAGGGVGQSYALTNPSFSLGVSGTPRRADVSATFPLASVPTHVLQPYFYMGGNPFASPFNVDGISATNGTVQGLVYAWDPTANGGAGNHVPLARSGTLNGTGDYAAVWQGLMIEVTPTGTSGPTIGYDYEMTNASASPTFYGLTEPTSGTTAGKSNPTREIVLSLHGTTASGTPVSDRAWLRFLPDATTGFDRYDGSKFGGGAATIAFLGERDGQPYRLAMASLPDGTSAPLPRKFNLKLQFAATAAGTYTLTWDNALGSGWRTLLVDRETGTRVRMWRETSYTFSATPGDWSDRFTLSVRPASDATTLASADKGTAETLIGHPFPNPAAGTSRLELVLTEADEVRIAVYDALGREVAVAYEGTLEAGTHTVALPAETLAPGTYVVRVEGDEMQEMRRLTVLR